MKYVSEDLSILKGRTRRVAEENVGSDRVLFCLLGCFNQALIALEDRLLIVKSGFMAGALGGARTVTFHYQDITAIEMVTGVLTGVIEIGTPSYKLSTERDWWSTHPDRDPAKANNCLPIFKEAVKQYQPYVERLRQLIRAAKAPAVQAAPPAGLTTELEKLASLHESGVLTDEEYSRAKERLLEGG